MWISEAVHPAIKKPAYQIRMPEVQAFVTVRKPLLQTSTARMYTFKRVRNFVDKCLNSAEDSYKDCYHDLFNSDYFWA